MTERPYIKPQYIMQAAEDIGIVARHVMKQPRGYAIQEVERARVTFTPYVDHLGGVGYTLRGRPASTNCSRALPRHGPSRSTPTI